jgi:integral membrane sensor domain MASE1
MYYARTPARYAVELLIIGGIYFVLAKIDWALGAPYTFSPISLAPGFGLGAVLLLGTGVWPAIFAAAFAACAPDLMAREGLLNSAPTVLIAVGNALETIVSGYLVNTWADRRTSFETPGGTARFAIISTGPGAMLGATIGTFALWLLGSVGGDAFGSVWIAWWLRDASGLLVVAPATVLFAPEKFQFWKWETLSLEGKWFCGNCRHRYCRFDSL